MKNRKTFIFGGGIFAMVVSMGTASAVPVPVDLSLWTVEQYQFPSQGNANWVLSSGNTVANQTVNADASILLSDFNIVSTEIEGSWRVDTTGDNDFMGFVFGYQDRGSYYLFDWKQGNQTHVGVFSEQGMSIKVVDVPGNADPSDADLWITAGNANVTTLRHNTISWQDLTDYDFKLTFFPGVFQVEVSEGNTLLESWTVNDNTYTDGQFGFYNYSQGNVVYRGFTQEEEPEPIPTIPEPVTATLGLLSLGTVGLVVRRRSV